MEQLNLLSPDIKVVSAHRGEEIELITAHRGEEIEFSTDQALQKSQLEELIAALEFVQKIEEFASITEGSSRETVEDAILYLESPTQKQQMNCWLETLDFPG